MKVPTPSVPDGPGDHVAASLDRAARSAAHAAHELAGSRGELVQLMSVRARRPWTAQEFERYLALSRTDIALQRSFAKARRMFNHARLRDRDAS